MTYNDPKEMAERAYEHGQDDAAEGRSYIPCLYTEYGDEIQAAYQRGYDETANQRNSQKQAHR